MKNIVLIGTSGVGKKEKGKWIASSTNWGFVDTDSLIVERENMSIDDIFTRFGEEYFRDLEMKVIEEVSDLKNTVISTGTEVILRKENIEQLRKNGYIFLLLGNIQTMVNNLKKSSVIRPLFTDSFDLYGEVERLFKGKEDLYVLSSDAIIVVDDKSKQELSKEVLMEYQKLTKIYN